MRILIFIVLLLPSLYLAFELFILQSVNDPIKYIYTITGACAIIILFLTTTLSLWFKKYVKYRRLIGLFAFYYASLHMVNFLVLDMEFDFVFAYEETIDKPFIYLGMISFFILVLMTLTSSKKLFRKFNKYHKFLYIVLILTTVHFIMAQKSLAIYQYGFLVIIGIIAFNKIKQRIK